VVIDSSTPYPQAVLADQPLLYYRLDELSGSTAYDSSGNGFNGIYSNVGHDPGPAPALGSSASFHGETTEGTIAVPVLSGSLPQVTVEAWVHLNTWNTLPDAFGNIGVSGIYAGDFWQPGSFQVGVLNPNQLQVSLFGAAGQGFSERFFIEDDAVTTGANAVPVNLTSAHIGAWLGFDGSFYRFLDGQIDEVAVYAAALSPDRIAAHYQAAFAPITGPLITYTLQGATMQVSWSGGSGFMLQHNSDPNDPAGWTDLPAGNFSPITVSLGSAQDFFRLRKL
jgi:hypothetical protein